ncbi:unnamed protein product [Gulo gulo]|uniref:Uncharacterized protein n=1 Tax=Gulo gulo TaxID=48420 RepID=A0A9X9ME17_GULGU|nr:unnamed protein product [Gulo gulo]
MRNSKLKVKLSQTCRKTHRLQLYWRRMRRKRLRKRMQRLRTENWSCHK